MKLRLLFMGEMMALILGFSACTHTDGEIQIHVRNKLPLDITVAYSYYTSIDKMETETKNQTINAGQQQQLLIPQHTVREPAALFSSFDVLSTAGDTLIHDAHKQNMWIHETERIPQSSRYHIYDVFRYILVVE